MKYCACLLFFLLAAAPAIAQPGSIAIPFIGTTPVIDGVPDTSPVSIAWREFSSIEKSSDANADVRVRYHLAYGVSFLYVLIEAESDSIVVRDRAYQNGDGFHLVVAKPDTSSSTREFYVVRFSPANGAKQRPAQKSVWYYNVDLSGRSLSTLTRFACASRAGKSYFELLLSWSDVHPYHPFFSDGIGINLCFVKAVGEKEKNYYFLKNDQFIQSEQHAREYLLARFAAPEPLTASLTSAQLSRSTIHAGGSASLRIVVASPVVTTRSVYCTVQSADGYVFADARRDVQAHAGITADTIAIPVGNLAAGGYRIVWKCSDNSSGELPLTVLPEISERNERARLDALARGTIMPGSLETMRFRLEDILRARSRIKPYETSGALREEYAAYSADRCEMEQGRDVIAGSTGVFRRAFRSRIDGTLQPYTVKVPQTFDRRRRYPLFVMLHGSGSDDRGMLSGVQLTENDRIEIAPCGRGTSNCYTTDGAEIDVKEAIEDAVRNYPIDTTSIVIGGFSMGGYGAYRIFSAYPSLFKAVAVFSGHPNLASQWIGPGHPDFLDPATLRVFAKTPVFIYHSRNDLNCPYDLTRELVGKLRRAGARVTFVTSEEGGHGVIDNEHIPAYYRWLSSLSQ